MKDKDHLGVIPAVVQVYHSSRYRIWLISLLLMLAGMAGAQTLPGKSMFSPGEEVRYDLYFKWGILMPKAGQATLSINQSRYEDKPAYHYQLLFYTSGLFEKVYKMRDTIDCTFSKEMLLLHSQKRINENDYYMVDDLTFDYQGNQTVARSHRYTPTRTKIDTTLVSEQYMFDMLGATMYLRSLDWETMKSGDEFPFHVAIGRDRINISFRYTGQQIVERNETLKYRTRHFYIDIYDDAFTQSKAAAEIWIGDDANHIPVKVRAKLKIGAAEVYYKDAKGLRYPLTSRVVIPVRRDR